MPAAVTSICVCDARRRAMRSEQFRYSHLCRGWVFLGGPLRWMSPTARYWAFVDRGVEFPHEDHAGEPYVYLDCPYCGSTLPAPLPIDGMGVTDGDDAG